MVKFGFKTLDFNIIFSNIGSNYPNAWGDFTPTLTQVPEHVWRDPIGY